MKKITIIKNKDLIIISKEENKIEQKKIIKAKDYSYEEFEKNLFEFWSGEKEGEKDELDN